MIEIYPYGSDIRVPLAGELTRGNVEHELEGEYHYDSVFYDLSELRGLYQVLHRRSAAPEGLEPILPFVSGWGTFDGEDAVVTTVLLGIDPSLYDGDLPDGGP
jgi:hypothetical protein